jgi:hypothetical protein
MDDRVSGVVVRFNGTGRPYVCATFSDFTGYEDAGNAGAAGTGIEPCSASNARPLVARLRGGK